jgi:hypothetical protein
VPCPTRPIRPGNDGVVLWTRTWRRSERFSDADAELERVRTRLFAERDGDVGADRKIQRPPRVNDDLDIGARRPDERASYV